MFRKRAVFPGLWLWSVCAVILALVLFSLRPHNDNILAVPARPPIPDTTIDTFRVFDRSPHTKELLFSTGSVRELWFRDTRGGERCIASNVVRASFSPDGQKFAYSTSDDDLFIETVDGKQIARLARARDYTWSADSMAVTFLAIAAVDYPELEQIIVYEILSNQTRFLPMER
jgi:hypothetical protein